MFSDKAWVFDQLEREQGPFYIMTHNISRKQRQNLKDFVKFLSNHTTAAK